MGKAGVGKAAHRRREVGEDLAEEGGREARQRATDAGEGGVQLEHRGKLEADEGAERHALIVTGINKTTNAATLTYDPWGGVRLDVPCVAFPNTIYSNTRSVYLSR